MNSKRAVASDFLVQRVIGALEVVPERDGWRHVSHERLATALGVSTQSIVRAMNRLRDEGRLERRRTVRPVAGVRRMNAYRLRGAKQ